MDRPNLNELYRLSLRLRALCEDPRPSLSTWRALLADVLRQIDQFHPDGARPLRGVWPGGQPDGSRSIHWT